MADEEVKTGEMLGGEEEDITIISDYTALESASVIIDDDSNLKSKSENLYEQAITEKEQLDEVRQQLKDKILAIIDKGEVSKEDNDEIKQLQDKYTEKYTSIKDLEVENKNSYDSSNIIEEAIIDYKTLIKILMEKSTFLYLDDEGNVCIDGESVPKIKVMELEAEKIKADIVETNKLVAEEIEAVNAKIDNLEVGDLTAVNADITNLKANVANINTLVTGNAVIDASSTIHLTSSNAVIDNAVIKDAMVESLSAAKINAGTLNTNLVNIASDTGGISISKETMQFKDKDNNVRIQIGRDNINNFTFALYDSTGKGQLINQDGIQSSDAIADGLIRNDHIDDNANISGGKIDISSLFDVMNDDGSNTLKSSKVYFDDKKQTLDVAFNDITTKVDGNTTKITTNTTDINIANGKIDALITSTEGLEGETNSLNTKYNSIQNTVDSHAQTIGNINTTVSGISSKQTKFEQDLSKFETTVSSTYATKKELSDEVEVLETNVSSVKQTADKIDWLVKGGTSSSDMVLTDKLYELTTAKAIISAKDIELNGSININNGTFTVDTEGNMTAKSGTFTGTIKNDDGSFEIDEDGNIKGASLKSSSGGDNGNFSIDSEGNIEAANLAVEGSISTDTVACNNILNKAYPKTLISNATIYVTSSGDDDNECIGDDDNECINGAQFATLQGAIDSIPKNMNGKTVQIHLQKDTVENIHISHIYSGVIQIFLNQKTIYGYVQITCCGSTIQFYGGDSASSTSMGTIRPTTGTTLASRTTSVSCDRCSYVSLACIKVYSSTNQYGGYTSNKVCVGCQAGICACTSIQIINAEVGFRVNTGGHIHMNSSSGIASVNGFQAITGGRISFSNSSQAGGTGNATYKTSGGQIWYDSATFESGNASTDTSTPSTTAVTKTATYTSSAAQAIQYYGQSSAKWRTDSKPKVGTWGYGPHTAWWFFGDAFAAMANKNVTKITITFTRNSGGNYAAHTHNFYTHNYESQPSTVSPSYYSTEIGSCSVATNTSGSFDITDSTLIAKIKSYKGICSIPPSQSNDYYSVFSATMKVKFTYTE